MSLNITPEIMRAAYSYLCETAPFNKWNLPDGEDIVFRVARGRACHGWHNHERGKHLIAISTACTGHTVTLMATMAHEMVHVHEAQSRSFTSGEHSAAFNKWAAQVCRVHGFDPKTF